MINNAGMMIITFKPIASCLKMIEENSQQTLNETRIVACSDTYDLRVRWDRHGSHVARAPRLLFSSSEAMNNTFIIYRLDSFSGLGFAGFDHRSGH